MSRSVASHSMGSLRWVVPLLAAGVMTACGGGGGGGSSDKSRAITVSATGRAAPATVMDSDTNDPLAPAAANDTALNAQPIPNPVVVGGFAAASGTGMRGDRFASQPDQFDSFSATLAAGDTITLAIADPPGGEVDTPDLDLYLYRQGDTDPIRESVGPTQTEQVTVPQNGSYFIVVKAFSGSSNYVFHVFHPPHSAAPPRGSDFVLGQLVVRFEDNQLPTVGAAGLVYGAAQTGLRTIAGNRGRAMLCSLPRGPSARAQAFAGLGVAPKMHWGGFDFQSPEARLRHETLMVVKALRKRPDVRSASPNYIARPMAIPNDPLYQQQWHYPLINLPQAWDAETGVGKDVIVAVVDTGVYLEHPDLSGKLIRGYDFIRDPLMARDGDGIDPDPNDPGDSATPGGSSYHGTHVAGTIAANTNNAKGVAGVSWGAKIMPLRVLGVGGGTCYDILQAVRYAARLSNDSGTVPARPADIINLSLGGSQPCAGGDELYAKVRDAGIIVIAAAGNENTDRPDYPASQPGVISVAAVDIRKQRAPYSNFGATVDVAAPGGGQGDRNNDGNQDMVLSTIADDSGDVVRPDYAFFSGTSMAVPHMAGVVALMEAVSPGDVSPSDLDAWLRAGLITEDIANNGAATRHDDYGYGLIDARKAVVAASAGAAPATLAVTPSALDFGTSLSELTMLLEKVGIGTLAVDSVTADAPWLSATGTGLRLYKVSVARAGLPDDDYAASIRIDYTVDDAPSKLFVPVTLQVGVEGEGPGDTGFTRVILWNPVTETTVRQTTASNDDGIYRYALSDVPPGAYYLIAGSDSDNDKLMCDAGESCGGYPTLGDLALIQVSGGDVSNLDFPISFSVSGFTGVGRSAIGGSEGFSRLPHGEREGFSLIQQTGRASW